MEEFNESIEIIEKYKEHFSNKDYVKICGLLKGFYDRIMNDDYSEYSDNDLIENSEIEDSENDSGDEEESDEEESVEENLLDEESPEMKFYDWIECKCVGLKLCSNHIDLLECKNLEKVKSIIPTLNYYLNDDLVKQDFKIRDEIGIESFKEIFRC